MTEAEDTKALGRTHWIQMRTDAEHFGPLLRDQRVVERDHDPTLWAQLRHDALEEQAPDRVSVPRPAREESVEALMMQTSSDVGDNQCLSDGVHPDRQYPAGEHHPRVS